MVSETVKDAEQRMEKTFSNTQSDLGKVRTGRANLAMLDTITVDYYGSNVPLKQVANLGVPEPRLITIQPWDRNMPNNDGHIIRLPIPPLTEDRRKDYVKIIHQLGEEGKVAIRNIRRDALEHLKKAQREHQISEDEEYNGGIDIQELTDKFIEKIDESIKAKEKELMEV